jgi:hypothetical protein
MPLDFGEIIAKIADLGSKNAGASSEFFGENCIILKKISIEIGVCYIRRKIIGAITHINSYYIFFIFCIP